MKYVTASLLALAVTLLPSLQAIPAQGMRTLPASACHVLNDRDFAAAGVPQPRLLAGIANNTTGCVFVFGAPPHSLTVGVRLISQLRGSDPLQRDVCTQARKEARPGQTCTPVSGYGRFGALLNGIRGPGVLGAALIFQTSRYQISLAGMGVPGGSAPAVQRLGKILASRYR